MVLKFDLTLEDLVAFTRYHNQQSPTMQKIKINALVVWGFVFFWICLIRFQPLRLEVTVTSVAIALVGASIYCIGYSWMFGSNIAYAAKEMYQETQSVGMTGSFELEIDHEKISERREGGGSYQEWRTVLTIVETENHVFLYISSVQAHIIPKHGIQAGMLDQFVDQAKKYWQDANPQTRPES